jgi:hypothetical protein
MLTFGGEHHEDQEDQEHPRCYGELSEEDEEGGEDLSPLIGSFYGVLLDWIGFEVVGREDGLDLVYGLVRVPAALDCRTPVGDEDLVDSTFLADVLLQVPKRHHHRDIRGGVGSALVDPGYLQLGRAWLGGKRPYLRIGGASIVSHPRRTGAALELCGRIPGARSTGSPFDSRLRRRLSLRLRSGPDQGSISFAKLSVREQLYGRSFLVGSEACRKFEVTYVIGSALIPDLAHQGAVGSLLWSQPQNLAKQRALLHFAEFLS